MFDIDVELHGEAPFRNISWVISDNLYAQWNSYGNKYEDEKDNYITLFRDISNPHPMGATREPVARVKINSKREYTEDMKVHKKFIEHMLGNVQRRHSMLKQIFEGLRDY